MAGITLAQAEAKLTLWLEAEEAVATRGQRYEIGDRMLERADLDDIRKSITYWQGHVDRLTSAATGRGGLRYAVPE